MRCVHCGKRHLFGHFCIKCRANIPTDFPKSRLPTEKLTDLKRNQRLKQQFQSDMKMGRLDIDTLAGIFRIGNNYHRLTELADYSFHASAPFFKSMIWRREVYENIFFTYQLRNGIRITERIDTAICSYENTGTVTSVAPPLALHGYKQSFRRLITDYREKLRSDIPYDYEQRTFSANQ